MSARVSFLKYSWDFVSDQRRHGVFGGFTRSFSLGQSSLSIALN